MTLRESNDLLHVSASLHSDIHTHFCRDFYAHRVLPLPQAAASFQHVSRGDTARIRARHFAESGKNRNAHGVSHVSVGDHEVTRVDRDALALDVVSVAVDGNRDVINPACRLACR